MAIREGRWDCPSCGSTAVYGRHVDCPGCGRSRPAGIRFYLTGDAPAIVDSAQLREARSGPDWICEHCGATCRAALDDCDGCGAPRGGSATQAVRDYSLAHTPRSGEEPGEGNAADGIRRRPDGTIPGPLGSTQKEPPSRTSSCLGCGCMVLVFLFVLSMIMSAIASIGEPRPAPAPQPVDDDLTPAVVTSMRWERSLVVEQRRWENGEGWVLPDSAEVRRARRRFREMGREIVGYETVTREVPRTERVSDGTRTRSREVSERVETGSRTYVCGSRDLGNGYFQDIECTEPVYGERSRTEEWEEPVYREETYYETVTEEEPVYREVAVYDTFYTYRVPHWEPRDTLHAAGDTAAPAWPEPRLRRNQRIGARTEAYWVSMRKPDGKPHGTRVELHTWLALRRGQAVALRVVDDDDAVRSVLLPADSLSECRFWHGGNGSPPPDSLGCSARAAAP